MRSDPLPSRLTYSTESTGTGSLVVLTGEIDLHTIPVLEEAIAGGAPEGDLVLDLAAVTFLDSAGLRTLVAAHEGRNDNGAGLSVRNPSDPARRVLEITGLADLLGADEA